MYTIVLWFSKQFQSQQLLGKENWLEIVRTMVFDRQMKVL